MIMDTTRITEEFEAMGLFKKGELTKMTSFIYIIARIDDKWDLLSLKEQNRVCFLLSAVSLCPR